jgi:hypothetical protein
MPGQLGAGTEAAARYCEQLLGNAAAVGIAVPGDIPAADDSAVYRSLTLEMRLANSVINGSYAATWPHLKLRLCIIARYSAQQLRAILPG